MWVPHEHDVNQDPVLSNWTFYPDTSYQINDAYVIEQQVVGERQPRLTCQAKNPKYWSEVKSDRSRKSRDAAQAIWKLIPLANSGIDTINDGIRIVKLYYAEEYP